MFQLDLRVGQFLLGLGQIVLQGGDLLLQFGDGGNWRGGEFFWVVARSFLV